MPRDFAFSKINAGKIRQRGKFNLSHSVLTTSDFGSVMPVFSKLMLPKSSLKGKITNKIRVMPMALPPFGKVGYHMYGQFVPITDLWRVFPEFVAKKVYNGPLKSYVPDLLPSLPVWGPVSLMSQLLSSKFSVWQVSKFGYASDDSKPSAEFNGVNLYVRGPVIDNNNFGYPNPDNLNQYFGFLGTTNPNHPDEVFYNGFGWHNMCQSGTVSTKPTTGDSYDVTTDVGKCLAAGMSLFPDTADFRFVITKESWLESQPTYQGFGTQDDGFIITVALTREGRQLLKVLNNLGIQVSPWDTSRVNMLPLFATYKAYFDIFYPQREIEWTSTNLYKLLDYITLNNIDLAGLVNTKNTVWGYSPLRLFNMFMEDVADMFATSDPDYITSSVEGPGSSEVDGAMYDIEDVPASMGTRYTTAVTFEKDANSGEQPNVSIDTGSAITRYGLQLLNSLSKFINTNSVIGQNLDAFFKAHFDGYSGKSVNSKFAGSSVTDIQLGDIISQADSGDRRLGDFAGAGFGSGDYVIKYNSGEDFGYFIVLAAIIPTANYVQGTEYDNYITRQLELPWPEFDAKGYDTLRVGEVVSDKTYLSADTDAEQIRPNSVFGYQPRYTGHKVHKSVLSGDASLVSTRDGYLGFSLDRYMSTDVTRSEVHDDGTTSYYMANPRSSLFRCGTYWRWLGKYQWLNNFRRIFYDSNPVTSAFQSSNVFDNSGQAVVPDGFVIYSDVDVTYNAPLKNISASYDTLSQDGSDNFVNHQ